MGRRPAGGYVYHREHPGAPATIAVSTYGGEALGSQNYTMALIIFAFLILAGIAGMLVYRRVWKPKKSPKE